jgi:hypothetical protein
VLEVPAEGDAFEAVEEGDGLAGPHAQAASRGRHPRHDITRLHNPGATGTSTSADRHLRSDPEPAIRGVPKSPKLGRGSLAGWTVPTVRGREDALAEVSVPS